MTSDVFVDTNVLVYMFEAGPSDPRTAVAQGLFERFFRDESLTISAQVVTEFVSVAGRKMRTEITRAELLSIASDIVDACRVVPLDEHTSREALRVSGRYGLDYLDAQIWAAAYRSGCTVILTEDAQGDEIEGVRYVNPFVPGFDVGELVP